MSKKKKVLLSESESKELYHTIDSFYLSLRSAEIVDKFYLEKLKFWTPSLNNHLRTARRSINQILIEFNDKFKAVDYDRANYEAPSVLLELIQKASRMSTEEIEEIIKKIENE